jgi:hypothetical protein
MLKLRRGTDAERSTVVFADGEPVWTTDKKQLWEGDGITAGGILIGPEGSESATEGIIAFAGGGQADATELISKLNAVDTVASNGDSVKCDAALQGKEKVVFNSTANDMDLFPAIGEELSNGTAGLGVDTALSIAGGNSIRLICFSDGVWRF